MHTCGPLLRFYSGDLYSVRHSIPFRRHTLTKLSPQQLQAIREAGPKRVKENFSDAQMASRLDSIYAEMDKLKKALPWRPLVLLLFTIVALVGGGLAVLAPVVHSLIQSYRMAKMPVVDMHIED